MTCYWGNDGALSQLWAVLHSVRCACLPNSQYLVRTCHGAPHNCTKSHAHGTVSRDSPMREEAHFGAAANGNQG